MEQNQINLESLNQEQLEAVTSPENNILVLAGAGSGKTRVIVHRIQYLISEKNYFPSSILSVTFTNKAAQEMKSRLNSICQIDPRKMWIGTFHGLAHKLLRIHHTEAGLPQDFVIMDSEEQFKLVKKIAKENNIDEKTYPIRSFQNFINSNKDKAIRAQDIDPQDNIEHALMSKVYKIYEQKTISENLVDFSELLLKSYEILKSQENLRLFYQNKFEHILVDEFQDTNPLQYNWLKLLKSESTKIMVVGDDDQSIYTWRGARIENILDLQKDFSDIKVIRLEQNYRSTKNILSAANSLIKNNKNRWGKSLWTDLPKGESITCFEAFNDQAEAKFITDQIQLQVNDNQLNHNDIGILYRTNAQSRVLEEALMKAGVQYSIYGGLKFFDRAEIKNIMAYLRLSNNPNDNQALNRIVNTPARGIGKATWEKIQEHSVYNDLSLWESCNQLVNSLPSRAKNGLLTLINNIKNWNSIPEDYSLDELAQIILKDSCLIDLYKKEPKEQAQNKIENLNEFITACAQYQKSYLKDVSENKNNSKNIEIAENSEIGEIGENNENNKILLSNIKNQFLADMILDADYSNSYEQSDKNSKNHQSKVQLMTIHAAKGLEFPVVFCCGLEENLFPAYWNQENQKQLEEERRLCYVAITRAKQKLFLTHAQMRDQYGKTHQQKPSRFIQELNTNEINFIGSRNSIKMPRSRNSNYQTKPQNYYSNNTQRKNNMHTNDIYLSTEQMIEDKKILAEGNSFKIGTRVSHPRFGSGTINNVIEDEQTKVEVNFDQQGIKTLILKYARLDII